MKTILLTLILSIGTWTISQAQFTLTPSAGPAFPTGNFANFAEMGYGFGLEGAYAISEHVRAGVSFKHYRFGANAAGFSIPGLDFTMTPITASVEFSPAVAGVQPYIGLRGGVYNVRVNTFLSITRSYFGLAPTVGVRYPINSQIAIHANAEYHTVFVNESIPFTELVFDQNVSYIPINVGVSFKF